MGSPCPSNLSSWTDPTVNTTVKIKIEHLNELRSAINREQNRRSLQSSFSDPNISHTTNKINIGELKSIRDGINSIGTVSWNVDFDSITTSNKFETNHLIELRNQINNFEAQCLCDCDYCSCNTCPCPCNVFHSDNASPDGYYMSNADVIQSTITCNSAMIWVWKLNCNSNTNESGWPVTVDSSSIVLWCSSGGHTAAGNFTTDYLICNCYNNACCTCDTFWAIYYIQSYYQSSCNDYGECCGCSDESTPLQSSYYVYVAGNCDNNGFWPVGCWD